MNKMWQSSRGDLHKQIVRDVEAGKANLCFVKKIEGQDGYTNTCGSAAAGDKFNMSDCTHWEDTGYGGCEARVFFNCCSDAAMKDALETIKKEKKDE